MLSQSTKLYKNLQRHYSRRINLDLQRIKNVLAKLNRPELEIKNPINILGSDGKMSILTSLKYFLMADKKKVNTFTSPHLYDFRHRIWLENRFITLSEIKKYRKIIENTGLKLTLFELLTCIYILAAKNKKKADYNLIEAGLLFKKDSTNLWREPKIQVVGNVNYQHQDWVKPQTLEEICKQKISSLSNFTTIYIAKQNPKTLKIIKNILNKNKSKKIFYNKWKVKKKNKYYIYKDEYHTIPIKSKNIHSKGLNQNLGLAIKIALDLGISKKKIIKTIPKIQFEGRIQYIRKGNLKKILNKNEEILIDGCHSIESAKNLYSYLKTLKTPIYGIWGMSKNKLPEKFIKEFKKIFKQIVIVKVPNEKNSCKILKLKNAASKYFNVSSEKSIALALKKLSSKQEKTIVVFGSLYLIGEFLKKN